MDMKFFHPALILLGALLAAAAVIGALFLGKRQARRAGIRAANTRRFRALNAYKRKRRISAAVRAALAGGLAVALAACLCLAARPYRRRDVREEVTRKDIFLCMDISSSACGGAADLVERLRGAAEELDGDQAGVFLFNTSGVQYVPVTEDHAYLALRLGELAAYYRAAEEFKRDYADAYAYVHEIPPEKRARYEELNAVLSAFDRGATAGYEKKGTSVVGEGLAACLFSFPELHTETRPRIILFVTDNRPEVIGEPLTTLREAADMCARDGVTVYGVYPAAEETDETARARAEMKAAAEATGGAFFDLGAGDDPAEILSRIRGLEDAPSRTAVAVKDTDTPEGWTLVMIGGLALACAALAFQLVKTGRMLKAFSLRRKLLTLSVFAAAAFLAAMVAARPMRMDPNARVRTANLDVCFAVDTTISMWAEDGAEGETRMEGVKRDISRIMDALPGSSFSLIRFDNGAQVLAPYIRSIAALEDCVNGIGMPNYATATGSSPNALHDTLAGMLLSSRERTGDRRTVVFVMSDGEITDGSELMSFRDLRANVDDGAVLGYGTPEGGRMTYPGRGVLRDPVRNAEALSKTDEKNLKAMAKDLGVNYLGRTGESNDALDQVLSRVRRMSRNAALDNGDRTGWRETYHYYAFALALILTACLFRLIRRGSLL